jgi:hypothetical protein
VALQLLLIAIITNTYYLLFCISSTSAATTGAGWGRSMIAWMMVTWQLLHSKGGDLLASRKHLQDVVESCDYEGRSTNTIVALLNKRSTMLVAEYTCLTLRYALGGATHAFFRSRCSCSASRRSSLPSFSSTSSLITFNWSQESSDLMIYPVSSLVLAPFSTSQSLARILHLQRWPQRYQGAGPTVCQTDANGDFNKLALLPI